MNYQRKLNWSLILTLCVLANTTNGESSPQLDEAFRPLLERTGTVVGWRVRETADNKLLVGGRFDTVDGKSYKSLVRLNLDGSVDESFNIGTGFESPGQVRNIIEQPDGRILLGGQFSLFNSEPVNNIVRLNPDGSLDQTFDVGTGPEAFQLGITALSEIALQKDGKILVSGWFEEWDGKPYWGLVRLESNGSVDESFKLKVDPDTELPFALDIYAVLEDQRLLVAGDTTGQLFVNGNEQRGLFILNPDGSLDESFNVGMGPNDEVNGVQLLPNGKILVGGFFTEFDGHPRNQIARLNADGSLDPTFVSPPLIGTASPIGGGAAIGNPLIQPDGKILISGVFSQVDGTSRNSIARLNADGSLDRTFDPGTGAQTGDDPPEAGIVFYLDQQSDGKILAFGLFETYNGVTQPGVVRLLVEDGPQQTASSITEIKTAENGLMELTISKAGKGAVIVQATEQFKTWTEIARIEEGPGTFQLQDTESTQFDKRFYRVVSQ